MTDSNTVILNASENQAESSLSTIFTKRKTKEDADRESKIATQSALINIGREKALHEHKKIQRDKEIANIKTYFCKYENCDIKKTVNQMTNQKDKVEITRILDYYVKYMNLMNSLEEENLIEFNKIKKENSLMKEEITELISDSTQTEERIDTYWKPRVDKLRNKCIFKNRFIKFLYLVIVLTNLHNIYMTYYGLESYVNDLNNLYLSLYAATEFIYHNVEYVTYNTWDILKYVFVNVYTHSYDIITSICYITHWLATNIYSNLVYVILMSYDIVKYILLFTLVCINYIWEMLEYYFFNDSQKIEL